jgi:hypothetical protein
VGLLFALNVGFSVHNGVLATPLAVALLIYEAWRSPRPRRALLLDVGKAVLLAGVLCIPFIWPLLRDLVGQAGYFRKRVAPRAIDPLFLLVPHPGQPLWGGAFSGIYDRLRSYPSVGFIAYVGISSIILAGVAFLRNRDISPAQGKGATVTNRRGDLWFWLGSTFAFLVLSFGTHLTIAGREMAWLPLPFQWLQYVPLFGRVRVPHRFLVLAVISLGLLAAVGSERLASRLSPSRRSWARMVLAGIVALDLLWLPYPMRELPRPAWIQALDDLPPGLAVLNIPGGNRARGADDMLLQTFHRRPITGGYVSIPIRHVSRKLERYPVLRLIFQSKSTDTGYTGPNLRKAIEAVGAGIVVVHLYRTPDRIRAAREEVRREHPGDRYRLMPYRPDQGLPGEVLDRLRGELRRNYGEPVHVSEGEVEIYLASPTRRELPLSTPPPP